MPSVTYISCVQCGKDFVSQHDETLFCSDGCRDRAIEEGVEDAKRRMRRNGFRLLGDAELRILTMRLPL